MAEFEHLFRPIRIGKIEISNRICFSAHATNFAEDNLPSERQAYYYAERAKGGAGLIVIGGSVVHETSNFASGYNMVSDERAIPAYRRITDMVHEYGTKIFTQIDHYGGALPRSRAYKGPLLGPSSVPDAYEGEIPKAIEQGEMNMVLDAFGKAVRVAKQAQFDGVEVLCAQGFSLVQQFMTPRINKRTDEYGGSLENRLRFPLRVLERIRNEADGLCVGMKLVGDELVEGGLGPEDIKDIAELLVASGHIDYLHICLGVTNNFGLIVPEMNYPAGFAAYLAGGVREVVNIPIVAVKRINDPILAEKILANGQADVIGMTRALIADPQLPNKAREGRLEDIRQCTGVNQDCIGRVMLGVPLGCIQNPAVGEEKKWGVGSMKPAGRKKRILVVGGGPGGLKVAEIAAERGHEVHLYEEGDELGGQILSIIKTESRKEFESILRYLRIRVQKLGVKVHLGTHASADMILGQGADAVALATGALPLKTGYSSERPHVTTLPGVEQDNVLTVSDIFEARVPTIGPRVLIIDEFGEDEAVITAEYLSDRGSEVEIVTRLPFVGMKVDSLSFESLMERLIERKVALSSWICVTDIEGKLVTGEHKYSKEIWQREVDTVVLVMGKRANDTLYSELNGRIKALHRVGDCLAPRKISDAIYEGHLLAREL